MRRLAVIALLVVLAGLGIAATLPRFGGLGDDGTVATYAVKPDRFVRRVDAEGNFEAVQATKVSAPPSVRSPLKIAWLAPDGSRVERDEVVIRFDPTDLEKKRDDGMQDRATADSRMRQTEVSEGAALDNLKRDASAAVLELEHSREFQSKDPRIFPRVEIIESEIDGHLATQRKEHAEGQHVIRTDLSQLAIDLLQIDRRKATMEIDTAESDLDNLEVRAPHDGIFMLIRHWSGPMQVGMTVWGSHPIAEIPDLETMKAKVFVLEADAGGLQPGIEAQVTIEAHPGRTYKATVKNVDALAQRRNYRTPVQYFGVELELSETDTELMKPGQRVRARLTLEDLEEALSVPRQAIFQDDGKNIVYIRSASGFEPREVEVGSTGLGRVVITGGIEPGDRIALRDPTVPLSSPEDTPAGEGGAGAALGASL
jgi:RND family efflux transporter MFP subunit